MVSTGKSIIQSETTILHNVRDQQGSHFDRAELRERKQIAQSLQDMANTMTHWQRRPLCCALIHLAEAQMSCYPQYHGHWMTADWIPVAATVRIETKMGYAALAGDTLLARLVYHKGTLTRNWIFWSYRHGCETALSRYEDHRLVPLFYEDLRVL